MVKVCKMANADEFISKMPKVGKALDGSVSAGLRDTHR